MSRYSARHNGYRVPCILGLIECKVSYKWTWLYHISLHMVNANGKRQCWMPFRRLLEVDISLCSCCLHFRNKKARWGSAMSEKHQSFKTKRLVYTVRLWYNGANRSTFMRSTIYAIAQSLWDVVNNVTYFLQFENKYIIESVSILCVLYNMLCATPAASCDASCVQLATVATTRVRIFMLRQSCYKNMVCDNLLE